MASIQRFNQYVDQLRGLYEESWCVPVPTRLSTDIVSLCDEPGLMEDVWLTPSPPSSQPRWLDDQNTRRAIRALLKADRCIEER